MKQWTTTIVICIAIASAVCTALFVAREKAPEEDAGLPAAAHTTKASIKASKTAPKPQNSRLPVVEVSYRPPDTTGDRGTQYIINPPKARAQGIVIYCVPGFPGVTLGVQTEEGIIVKAGNTAGQVTIKATHPSGATAETTLLLTSP